MDLSLVVPLNPLQVAVIIGASMGVVEIVSGSLARSEFFSVHKSWIKPLVSAVVGALVATFGFGEVMPAYMGAGVLLGLSASGAIKLGSSISSK